MKKLILKIVLLLILTYSFFLTSCNSGEEEIIKDPVIPSVAWNGGLSYKGKVGEAIIIKGENFSSGLEINIGNTKLIVNEVTNEELKFIVPEGVSSGGFNILYNGDNIHSGYFKVIENDFEYLLQNAGSGFKAFDFVTSKIGYYVKNDQLFKTIDGGVSWNTLLSKSGLFPVYAVSEQELWIDHEPWNFIKSVDGGKTWLEILPDGNSLVKKSLVNEQNVFVITYSSDRSITKLLRSKDGGNTWEELLNSNRFSGLGNFEILYNNDETLFLFEKSTNKLISTTNFIDWKEKEIPVRLRVDLNAKGQFLQNQQKMWSSSYYGLAFSSDGGENWSQQSFPLEDENDLIGRIHFFNEKEGMAISRKGAILRSSDSGETWSLTHVEGDFFEADFIDEEKVVIIGQGNASNGVNLIKVAY